MITVTASGQTAVATFELDTLAAYTGLRQSITTSTVATGTTTGGTGLETAAVIVLAGGVAWFLAGKLNLKRKTSCSNELELNYMKIWVALLLELLFQVPKPPRNMKMTRLVHIQRANAKTGEVEGKCARLDKILDVSSESKTLHQNKRSPTCCKSSY